MLNTNRVERLSHTDGVALSRTGQMQGWAKLTCSGRFVQSFLLPDGRWLEQWYAGVLGDKWFVVSADYPTAEPRHQSVLRQAY